MVDEMDPVAIQSDESFNVLCVSLGLHHTKNELEMVDLVFAETKKLRAKSEGLMMECLTELQDVRQAYNNELIAVKTEIGQQMESLQCELAKKSDELKNASVENQQQYIIKEKFKNFLNLMSDQILMFSRDNAVSNPSMSIRNAPVDCESLLSNSDNEVEENDDSEPLQDGNDEERSEQEEETLTEAAAETIFIDDIDDSEKENNPSNAQMASEVAPEATAQSNNSMPQTRAVSALVIQVPRPPLTEQASDSVPKKLMCFKCEESFLKETSFLNHLLSDHDIFMCQEPLEEDPPGKFVRVKKICLSSKRKRKADNAFKMALQNQEPVKRQMQNSKKFKPIK